MKFIKTELEGLYIIEPTVFEDSRGYFYESFNAQKFEEGTGISAKFVQDNQSFSEKGVLRGMHYQNGAMAQAKLVRVISGEVQDVAVDIRKGSATYGKHVSVLLTGNNKKQMYIPRGFAHGFLVLSEKALFSYKCDNFYSKADEGCFIFNDSSVNIEWDLPSNQLKLSDKDLEAPLFKDAINSFS